MKSENVPDITVDIDTANGNDAIADAVTGTESAAGIEDAAGIKSVAADVTDVATAADPGAAVRILKTASCQSLSGKSTLTYAIGANTAEEIGFCIVANSGGGLFNREWVPAASIKVLTDSIPKGLHVRSSTFAPLFIHKSTNSPSFLLATLLSEGLLQALPDKARCYQLTDPTRFIAEINALLETPVPFAPVEVATAPSIAKGFVTFGCFNNTAKLNAGVFEVWARVLAAVPDSRLLLKWRTFQDARLCQSVREAFAQRGIASERIELRGATFHADVLKQYADIDIALDPFPFTGGLTSCESLWMGAPVITWPQSQVVSRQTFAFLSAIGLPELAAQDRDDYVRIAVELAADRTRLAALRSGMRSRMQASPLMDVAGFTRQLENTLPQLYAELAEKEKLRYAP